MKVLIVSPHPDDETLGCGGTLLRHRQRGDELYWLIMTGISIEEGYDADTVIKRGREIDEVTNKYGFKKIYNLGFPTTKLDLLSKRLLVQSVSDILQDIKPEQVYLPSNGDVHSDHKITFEAIISATKTFRCPFLKKLLMYEVLSETEFAPPLINCTFIPNSFSEISAYLEDKIAIMHLYDGEVGKHPFPRNDLNIRALATFRGATAGVQYAEAFTVIKEIW